jgi:hypothetical protein
LWIFERWNQVSKCDIERLRRFVTQSTTINLGEEIQVSKEIEEGWDQHWKNHNAKFENFLNANLNLKILSNKMLYVWDENYSLKA